MRKKSSVRCFQSELIDELRKESDEEDQFYDRTIEPVQIPEEEKQKLKEEAKTKSYHELKQKLEYLLAEKEEINESLVKLAVADRLALQKSTQSSSDMTEDDLDKMIREDEKTLRIEQRKSLINRMKDAVTEIDE